MSGDEASLPPERIALGGNLPTTCGARAVRFRSGLVESSEAPRCMHPDRNREAA